MNSKKFYFLIEDLGEKRSGIETSSLNRARLFKEFLRVEPIIITSKYNPKLNKQRRDLLNSNLLQTDSIILNMYEYIQETITHLCPHNKSPLVQHSEFKYDQVNDSGDYRISKNDELIIFRKCDDEGTLLFNNLFMNQKKVRRNWYDSNGYLSKVQHLEPETGRVLSETYYRTDGTVCLYKHFEFINDKSKLMSIHLTDRKNEVFEQFKTESELLKYWFNEILDSDSEHILLIDKERIFYPVLSKLKSDRIKLICAIHSSHLATGHDLLKGRINSNYKLIFEDLRIPDAIVVLTEQQKNHIEMRYGRHDNIHVISHTLETIPKEVSPLDRIPKKAIFLGRFAEEKQLDHLIKAYKKVVITHPDAQLELYGFGSLEETYRAAILENNLSENIHIHGYKTDLDGIYDSAALALLPSKVEGFSLFLLEAMAHGCPMISYDIHYGPSDLIDHGINGYLVTPDRVDEMAERIIHFFDHPELLSQMSTASYDKFKEFHPKAVAEKWSSLI